MSGRAKTVLVVFSCLAVVVAVRHIQTREVALAERGQVSAAPNLSDHPIYREYEFGQDESVIDLGAQPLWIPTCLISETMRRDNVLHTALAEHGLRIRFHAFLKGTDVNFFLRRGELEVGIGGDMPALNAAADSNVLVATLIQQGFCSIVANRHMMVSELRNKRIGYAFGSDAHHALMHALSSAGLRETDVRMIPLDVNEMPDALAEGRIDAFSAWEPTPTIALTRFERAVVIHRNTTSGYLYFSRSFADRHPEAVRQIVASQLRSMKWLRNQKENLLQASRWALTAGRDLSGQPPVLSARQYVTLAKSDLLGISSIPIIPEKHLTDDGPLHREFEFLKGLGKIADTAEWDRVRSCFDHTIVEDVLSAGGRYRLYAYDHGEHEDEHHEFP